MAPATRRSMRVRQQEAESGASSDNESRPETSTGRRKRERPQTSTPRKRREPVLAIGRPRHANSTVNRLAAPQAQRPPPWPEPAKLPYDVLLSIFQYATYPLIDATNKVKHASWLVGVARLRRDFVEPALAALYYYPPLESAERAHAFLAAIQAQTENSMVDYRRRIRFLDLDAMSVLCFKFAGQDPLLLSSFISLTPMLRGLRINWPTDDPALPVFDARVPHSKVHLWYGKEVFDILEDQKVSLSDWKWNFAFGPTQAYPWRQLRQIHQRPIFQRLKKLECYQPAALPELAWIELSLSLGELPVLEDLVLCANATKSSNLLRLFDHVRPLRSLVFSHCSGSLDALTMISILQKKGGALRHLSCYHNPRLDLAFLYSLGSCCPNLQSLAMDFTFFAHMSMYYGSSPQYETLLPADYMPSWPKTLRHLRLVHLRKWDMSAATRFFLSLLQAVPDLTDLRYLELRMSIDADWKDRISFRNKWEALIPRVFRRPWVEPICWTASKPAEVKQSNSQQSTKRSERLKAAVEAEEASDRSSDDYDGPVQGLCNVVDVRVENLRPMERQLDESNFLDDELSGDEDYQN